MATILEEAGAYRCWLNSKLKNYTEQRQAEERERQRKRKESACARFGIEVNGVLMLLQTPEVEQFLAGYSENRAPPLSCIMAANQPPPLGGPMPVVQRPYVPPEDQTPNEDTYARPSDTQAPANEPSSLDPITFYADSMHIFSSLYSAVLFFGEQMEEREPILRARIKVSPQMLKAIALLTAKHLREYENAVGPISLPEQVYSAWELDTDGNHDHA